MPGTALNAYIDCFFHNKSFHIDAVLQKSSEGTMAQGDPSREEGSRASDAVSLAPKSGSDHYAHCICSA